MIKLIWTRMKRPPLHNMELWLANYHNTISFAIAHDKIAKEPEYSGFVPSWRDMRDDSHRPVKLEGPYDSLKEAQAACEAFLVLKKSWLGVDDIIN